MRTAIVVVSLATALVSNRATAQNTPVSPGVWQIGGSASANISPGASGSRSLSLRPRLAHFVIRGLSLGGTLPLGYTWQDHYHSTTYGIGPEVTYYFGSSARRLYPFVRAAGSVQWQSSSSDAGAPGGAYSIHARVEEYTGSAGVAAMVARNVALTGEVYYAEARTRLETSSGGAAANAHSSGYGFQFGVDVFLY